MDAASDASKPCVLALRARREISPGRSAPMAKPLAPAHQRLIVSNRSVGEPRSGCGGCRTPGCPREHPVRDEDRRPIETLLAGLRVDQSCSAMRVAVIHSDAAPEAGEASRHRNVRAPRPRGLIPVLRRRPRSCIGRNSLAGSSLGLPLRTRRSRLVHRPCQSRRRLHFGRWARWSHLAGRARRSLGPRRPLESGRPLKPTRAFGTCLAVISGWPGRPGLALPSLRTRTALETGRPHRSGLACRTSLALEAGLAAGAGRSREAWSLRSPLTRGTALTAFTDDHITHLVSCAKCNDAGGWMINHVELEIAALVDSLRKLPVERYLAARLLGSSQNPEFSAGNLGALDLDFGHSLGHQRGIRPQDQYGRAKSCNGRHIKSQHWPEPNYTGCHEPTIICNRREQIYGAPAARALSQPSGSAASA